MNTYNKKKFLLSALICTGGISVWADQQYTEDPFLARAMAEVAQEKKYQETVRQEINGLLKATEKVLEDGTSVTKQYSAQLAELKATQAQFSRSFEESLRQLQKSRKTLTLKPRHLLILAGLAGAHYYLHTVVHDELYEKLLNIGSLLLLNGKQLLVRALSVEKPVSTAQPPVTLQAPQPMLVEQKGLDSLQKDSAEQKNLPHVPQQ